MRNPIILIVLLLIMLTSILLGLTQYQSQGFQHSNLRPGQNEYLDKEFTSLRLKMVEQQLQSRGIQNPAVLKAMSKVPRHRFIPQSFIEFAYSDFPVSIGHRQTISQPYIVAYMLEAAEISPDETVLEIGTGSGYQAAILGEIAKAVYSIEIIPELSKQAQQTLKNLGYENVYMNTGNGYQGWFDHAPYDAIIVSAAPDRLPTPLIDQLASNGRMVIPVGIGYQELVITQKTPDGLLQDKTISVRFVPMTGKVPTL